MVTKALGRVHIVGGGVQKKWLDVRKGEEVWMLNGQMTSRPWIPVTRAFNIHLRKLLDRYDYDCLREIAWALKPPYGLLYTADPWRELRGVANAVTFPVTPLLAMPHGGYHAGSFDWMVAFAIHLKAKEICLHGINMTLEAGEPISARSCLEFWCGVAVGKGIKVTAAPDCSMFHFYHLVKSTLVYGYEDTPIFEDRTRKGVPYRYKP